MKRLARFVPAIHWLRTYNKRDLSGDTVAGLTVAVMLIPQGMAYAMLAGLPPIVGLYASVFPLLAYAFLGTSRQLAVGPVAMVSLLVAAGVGAIAEPGSGEYLALAILLAGMVGVLQLGMGLFRLGRWVSFLSHPVISGFTSAAAIIIGLSQLKHLLGVNLPRSPHFHELMASTVAQISETHLITLAIGAASVVALIALKKWNRRFPGALVVVVVATLVTWALGLNDKGVRIVGDVPSGLPSPSIPSLSVSDVLDLLPMALTLALVAFMESISVAKAFARRHRYEVDANQELVALGVANLVSFLFGAYPVAGGFGRSAIKNQAGAKTSLSDVITAVVIALSLLLFTRLFYFLPITALAAIVITAVFGLVDVKELVHLYKVKRTDAALLVLTFLVTLFVGIEEGIGAGVVASLGLFVHRSTRPHHAVLGRLPGTRIYRNTTHFPDAIETPGVKVWRFDASFYFANADFFRDQVDRLLLGDGGVRAIVLDASGINDLDASGEAMLHEIHARLLRADIQLFLAGVKGPVREVMTRGGLVELMGEQFFFLDLHDAVAAASAGTLQPVSPTAVAA